MLNLFDLRHIDVQRRGAQAGMRLAVVIAVQPRGVANYALFAFGLKTAPRKGRPKGSNAPLLRLFRENPAGFSRYCSPQGALYPSGIWA
jgi:hypothetical protein